MKCVLKGFICDYIGWKLKLLMQNGENWCILQHLIYAATMRCFKRRNTQTLWWKRRKKYQKGKVNCSLFPGFIVRVLNTISVLRWKYTGFWVCQFSISLRICPIKYKWWREHKTYKLAHMRKLLTRNSQFSAHCTVHSAQSLNFLQIIRIYLSVNGIERIFRKLKNYLHCSR